MLSGLEIIQQFFFLAVRSAPEEKGGQDFWMGCWELLGSSAEVPIPRQWCLALLNWAFVFAGDTHLPLSMGTARLLNMDLLLKKPMCAVRSEVKRVMIFHLAV